MNARAEIGPTSTATFADEPLRCAVERDTATVPAPDRFEVFRTWHSSILNVALKGGETITFEAAEKVWQLGEIVFSVIEASSTHLLRWDHKNKPAVDNWVITVRERSTSTTAD